ncbi:MAG: hypothetical protein A3F42_08160 [Gammaproteobacteria bacterium RIFCSPHIGHO2_12_FULL_37_34]|nr:MAG: hypothetical protein A3F42_08160 [Gammaproteobacteria bacterium RIFCSPHIGHO2_12_FULL_37_34]
MRAVKKTVSIPEELVKEARLITSNFSAIVEVALVAYLHHYRVQKATESFGKWKERKNSSVDLVNKLRQEDKRNHGNRTH